MHHKRTFIGLLISLLLMTLPAAASGPSVLFDPKTGEVISQDRAGEPWYPASLTKLMTAYLVFRELRLGRLTLDQKIPVSVTANAQPPSKIGVPAGKTVSVDFALQSLLVYSANDMAYVLADAAGGTWQNFVTQMNEAARTLGMTGTHYVNPNGLFEPRQISTARDIAILASALLTEFPEYAHYFSQPNLPVGKRKLANRNSLLRQMKEADGMKTGFVCNSGFNLVASATHEGRKLAAVVLGASSGKARADLAEMLLVDGFGRAAAAPRPKLDSIQNQPLGGFVPADLSEAVCRKKPLGTMTSARDLTGWAISFGSYDTAEKADMALRGRLISPSGIDSRGQAGVVQMPGKTGYAAVLWDLDQLRSTTACASYQREKAYCEVLTPDTLKAIAAMTPVPPPRPAKPVAQGSDGSKAKKKTKR